MCEVAHHGEKEDHVSHPDIGDGKGEIDKFVVRRRNINEVLFDHSNVSVE